MGTFRLLTSNDYSLYRDHLLSLDFVSRCFRFSGVMSDEGIENYASQLAFDKTDIVGYFVRGIIRGVAEIHYDRTSLPVKSELAFSIEEEHQNQRIGSKLMAIAIYLLNDQGINSADVVCPNENRKMYYLALKHGAEGFEEGVSIFMTMFVPYAIECSEILGMKDCYVHDRSANTDRRLGVAS